MPGCTQPNVVGVRKWAGEKAGRLPAPPLEVCSTETREGLKLGVLDASIDGGLVCISFGLYIIRVDLSLNLLSQGPAGDPSCGK